MSTLVINKASISVKLEANHLVLHDHADGGPLQRVPLVDVDRVIVVGQPAITFPVLAKLMDLRIPCSFLTAGGKWRGLMDGDGGFHAGRRIKQYAYVIDESKCSSLVRRLVLSKILNSRRTIQRLAAERGWTLDEFPEYANLTRLAGEISFMKTAVSIRGIEGIAAACYFGLLSRFFPYDAPFPRRSRRPPRDAANALMSFVYMLLANVFTAAVRAHGLDVAGGFFHRGIDRSPSLALDLMEPFRPAWADRLVLNLLNHRRIKACCHFSGNSEDGVFLNDEGRKIVFVAFDEMMSRRISVDGQKITLRQVVDKEICRFITAIEGGCEMQFFRAA